MDGSCYEFFARAGLSTNENGNIASITDGSGNNIALLGPDSLEITPDPSNSIETRGIYDLILANNPDVTVENPSNARLIRVHTYMRANDNRNSPEYSVTSSDESVVAVIGHTALTVIESVVLIEARRDGTAVIEIVDTANNNFSDSITIESRIGM